jgi:hypothetical protein
MICIKILPLCRRWNIVGAHWAGLVCGQSGVLCGFFGAGPVAMISAHIMALLYSGNGKKNHKFSYVISVLKSSKNADISLNCFS